MSGFEELLKTSTEQEILAAYFEYVNTANGKLIWKNHYRSNIRGSAVCLNYTSDGYSYVNLLGKRIKTHRVVWVLCNGEIPEGYTIDHINGKPSNNNISNLRLATRREQASNQKKKRTNKSGYCGVHFCNGTQSWVARWVDESGKTCVKSFSIKKYGKIEAKRLAILARREGASNNPYYTERHGKKRIGRNQWSSPKETSE